jgi:type II secretory pathway component PulJ
MERNQGGFTFVELAVVTALTAFVGLGATMATFQMVKSNERSSNHMTVVHQVENVNLWFSRDAQMTKVVDLGADQGFPLTLTWTEWDPSDEHQVVYAFEGSTLKRSHSVNGDVSESLVARNIDSDNTSCVWKDGVVDTMLVLTVTASVGEATEERKYEVKPRFST